MIKRVYVATKTDNWRTARAIQAALRGEGIEITYDWTKNVQEVGGAALKGEVTDRERKGFADADLQGVKNADALVLICYPGLCGALIEFGIALAEKKDIYVVGTPERDSVFFECDGVVRVPVAEGDFIYPQLKRAMLERWPDFPIGA